MSCIQPQGRRAATQSPHSSWVPHWSDHTPCRLRQAGSRQAGTLASAS
jgi:hypothetical protein